MSGNSLSATIAITTATGQVFTYTSTQALGDTTAPSLVAGLAAARADILQQITGGTATDASLAAQQIANLTQG